VTPRCRTLLFAVAIALLGTLAASPPASAAPDASSAAVQTVPDADPPASAIPDPIALVQGATTPTTAPDAPPASGAGLALQILLLMTVLSLLPALALTMTCFTRIIIVFSFLRQALGLPGAPPNQVLTGMALFLTAFVMAPTFADVHEQAVQPAIRQEIGATEAIDRASKPLATFMLRHTSDADLRLFYEVSKRPRPPTRAEVSMWVLVPAYTLGEVRTAFTMGFLVLVPFLVIDLVVSSVLMAMGMVMLPPALVTLPLKVLVFVLADGWGLVISSLVRSLVS
jgi:flagellar biosynthetic protein FliP